MQFSTWKKKNIDCIINFDRNTHAIKQMSEKYKKVTDSEIFSFKLTSSFEVKISFRILVLKGTIRTTL